MDSGNPLAGPWILEVMRGLRFSRQMNRTRSSFSIQNPRTRKRVPRIQNGFTLLEIIISVAILAVLTAAAIPMVRNSVKRERESELRLALRQMRIAIDTYRAYHEKTNGTAIPIEWKTQSGYPKNLEILVEGFIPANQIGTSGNRVRFLRRLPIDPMTGDTEWGMRSYKDKSDSTSWGGEDVFDVYTKSSGEALNGTRYGDW